MNSIFGRIAELKLVPVVKIDQAKNALPLADALVAGELPIIEITFRTNAAEEVIRILSESRPDILIGAGTVLSVENVRKAVDAGAKFIVSPGFNPRVVDTCLKLNIPVIPGVNSPTQVEMGLERGLKVLKFFPAEASGGMALLKAMAAPYGNIQFMPTGGINLSNLLTYLSFDRVIACGGTWFVKQDLINSGKFSEIAKLTQDAVSQIISKIS
jgi:2-dehydro-3-deoxyphosphogluconate aldolase/(4S)-4-hydroxy-2-oxoglutarate aldolase